MTRWPWTVCVSSKTGSAVVPRPLPIARNRPSTWQSSRPAAVSCAGPTVVRLPADVVTRLIDRGKHTGEFLGIPASNNDVQMEGIAIHRVVDGKIVEHWGQVDGVGMLAQMGALPPMGG